MNSVEIWIKDGIVYMGSRATAQGIEDHEIQICPRVLVSWSIGESMGSLGLRNIQLQLSQFVN